MLKLQHDPRKVAAGFRDRIMLKLNEDVFR
jgi:hypothetical protein